MKVSHSKDLTRPELNPESTRLNARASWRAVAAVLPSYIRPDTWYKSHFLSATKLSCVPVQKGTAPLGVWIVLQSTGGSTPIDANSIVRGSVRLAGVAPAQANSSYPVAHYRPSLHDLAFRFPAPYATPKSRIIAATGYYHVANVKRFACFTGSPLPTCP